MVYSTLVSVYSVQLRPSRSLAVPSELEHHSCPPPHAQHMVFEEKSWSSAVPHQPGLES